MITFDQLVANYPDDRFPCGDGWANQCALRMSVALEGAGFSFADYGDPTCSHGHARGAESLANHLWRTWGRPRIYTTPSSAKGALAGKQGVIFFKDIAGFRNGSGDHIDLWKPGTMTGEYFSYCKQVWFFDVV